MYFLSTIALQLIRVSNEPAVHVRTRAMKALSTIIAVDPGILSRVCTKRGVCNNIHKVL